ncbi:MAG TPA: bifunctional glutamate N-acetyltransferase/amino-acid acetyltransferase ArgJ [Casimicrobiaceae bacterium]|jgi:glutamate N-acetyltransferase/amino-acid N-acetyltransferase|nr:bifunctional glutamate N-acetyltransferase/amino-acid acetyltransferase ArgJ [Casimicrobiaceae bacterium]
MPVNYTPPTPEQLLPVRGITLGAAAAGIKRWTRDDVLLVKLSPGSHASGVFTQNRFCAAPVTVCREHLARGGQTRALLINAGNANAGTGDAGLAAARLTCAAVATQIACAPEEVLPFSTGVIMEPLPVDRIVDALPRCAAALTPGGWYAAARAIMTTDTVPKGASRRIDVDGTAVTVTGIAKGAGMIAPNMATLLAFVATDAPIAPALLRGLVAEIADVSFNRATIDGDTSTNDSFVVMTSAQAVLPPIERRDDPRLVSVRAALEQVAMELSQAIVRDGEGATKFITIIVEGGRDTSECDRVARTIAHSPLVKTAFFASDPNLGRIVCAIGNAGIADLEPQAVSFWLDEVLVVADGGRAASYREQDGQRVMAKSEISVRVSLGRGEATATVWTCDFSHGYVSINADYRS